MNPEGVTTIIAIVSTTLALLGVLVSSYVATREKRKDDSDEKAEVIASSARLESQLDSLASCLARIEHMVTEMDAKLDNHTERIVKMEGHIKALFRRRDEDSDRLKVLEDKHNENMICCGKRKE